jgi:putative thioredoxin
MNHSPWVIETTDPTFQADVIERSRERPWWSTSGPPGAGLAGCWGRCSKAWPRSMTASSYWPKPIPRRRKQAATQFGVQSIPAVFAVVDGQVEDYFIGVLPESQIRMWLDRLAARGEMAAARRAEATDPAAAEAAYRAVLAERPNEVEATVGLARALVAQSKRQEARELIGALETRGYLEPEAQRIKAELELGEGQGDLAKLKAAANPDDLPAQLRFAQGLAGVQRYQEALEICLSLVERDRPGVGEQARQLMVDIFRVLGDSDLARDYRRKLTTLLY